MKRTYILIPIFFISAISTMAFMMPSPDSYKHNECKLIAKDLVKAHSNANLVFILPLQDNGAYEMGEYSGHFLNAVTIQGKIYYIDYKTQTIMQNREEVLQWYNLWYGKHANSKAEIWDLKYERPPFPIIWHYP